MAQSLVVTFEVDPRGRTAIQEAIGDAGEITWLVDLDPAARKTAIAGADVLMSRNTTDMKGDERGLPRKARLIQFMSAGIDFIRLDGLPSGLPVACNAGAYSEPMAEHGLAMAFAASKRLVHEHGELRAGRFNQFNSVRMLAGGVCGILGFGGIGIATAKLMRAVGMKVHAINRRGGGHDHVDWMGTPNQTDELLAASDVLVLSLPLTPATRGMIDARALGLMKPDAILVNLARGEIVDEAALYDHLVANPKFVACIDAWWIEPIRHGRFEVGTPLLDLPNVIGSPHNSASVRGWRDVSLRRGAANCRRVLEGGEPWHLVREEDRAA